MNKEEICDCRKDVYCSEHSKIHLEDCFERWEWDGCHSFGTISLDEIEEYPWDIEFEYEDHWDHLVKDGSITKKVKAWDILPQEWKDLFEELKQNPSWKIVIWYDN